MNLRELIKKDFDIDFPISGSTASSQDNPLVIHRQEPNNPHFCGTGDYTVRRNCQRC